MFKDLIGIQGARDIKEREESVLERLLKIEERVVQEYVGKVTDSLEKNHEQIYLPLYTSLSSALSSYTEQDLQDLLRAKANNGYNDKEAQVLSIYTGVLLHVVTERCEQEEKSTTFTFDLNENEFHYLFYFAKRAGEVTIRKVKGKKTCSFMGSYGGQVKKLVIEQNTGNYAAGWAGSFRGTIGTLLIKQNTGNYAAYGAGSSEGTIGALLITQNTGYGAVWGAGRYGGTIDTLLITQNKGNYTAQLAGSDGGTIGTLAFYKAGRSAGKGVEAKRLVKGRTALKLYERLMREMK